MQLGFGIAFNDLYEREGPAARRSRVPRFPRRGRRALARSAGRGARQAAARAADESELLIALAPHVEDFIAQLFGIEAEAQALAERHHELAPLYSVKRQFVQRRALHKVKPPSDGVEPERLPISSTELDFARKVTRVAAGRGGACAGARARRALCRLGDDDARRARRSTAHGVLFKAPRKLDFMRLVPVHTDNDARLRRASPRAPAPARGLRAHRPRAPTSPARSTRRTTASGATSRARTPARRA